MGLISLKIGAWLLSCPRAKEAKDDYLFGRGVGPGGSNEDEPFSLI